MACFLRKKRRHVPGALILLALALGCAESSTPPAPQATPGPAARVMAVAATSELLDTPGGAVTGLVEPGTPLATGARRADEAGIVWIEVSTPDGRQGWLPESRLAPAGEEGSIATH